MKIKLFTIFAYSLLVFTSVNCQDTQNDKNQEKSISTYSKFTLSLGIEVQLIQLGNAKIHATNTTTREEFENNLFTGLIVELIFPDMKSSNQDTSDEFSVKAFGIISQIYATNSNNKNIHPLLVMTINSEGISKINLKDFKYSPLECTILIGNEKIESLQQKKALFIHAGDYLLTSIKGGKEKIVIILKENIENLISLTFGERTVEIANLKSIKLNN